MAPKYCTHVGAVPYGAELANVGAVVVQAVQAAVLAPEVEYFMMHARRMLHEPE
jgi:hypothetical protein